MELRKIQDADIQKGTRVIVLADFDVTLREGAVEDGFRIRQTVETLKFIAQRGGVLRIIAHLGRPGGKMIPALSLKNIVSSVAREFGEEFLFIENPLDAGIQGKLAHEPRHLFFENIRFWPGEEENSKSFAKMLAGWGDIYINEDFAVSHRAHASIVLLPILIPSFAGLCFTREVAMLSRVLESPEYPFSAVLGGEKIETKLALVESFLKKEAVVMVGGKLMNTLLAARGVSVGKSAVDQDFLRHPNQFVLTHPRLILPHDAVVARDIESEERTVKASAIAEDEIIFDIGPESAAKFGQVISESKMVIWNGPLGQAELKRFAEGTIAVAKSIQQVKGFTVVGGGHTVSSLHKYGLTGNITHISTGGGAMLEFLAGKKLPGIEALQNKNVNILGQVE
ncbi:MAG: phosphoglycerate kinase [Candidatus Sungbacteria bacterium]|nr:phosphoglycerate kinase [Candidatus Sungbacteria bacterium]